MKESDIRPDELFNSYLSLAAVDVKTYFENVPRIRVACPACNSTDSIAQFMKLGFCYEECRDCGTLFVNPRPDAESFSRYYTDSPSVEFWATHFYRETEESRRERLIRPKALMVAGILNDSGIFERNDACIVDIGAGYGIFCEEIRNVLPSALTVIALEPSEDLSQVCLDKHVITVKGFLEKCTRSDIPCKSIAAATSFELLEHLHDPGQFISACHSLLDSGGILILTTLSWDGFDLQVLREKSKSIHPPHHINFFTPRSIRIILERYGFMIRSVTTPGKLDVDIAAKQIQDIRCGFVRNILTHADENIRAKLQQFLQDAKLSSHMMVIAEKR